MNCRELSDFLHDYVAGDLGADILAEFQVHLKACHNCVAFLTQYRETITLGGEVAGAAPEIPEDLVQAILKTLKK